MCAFLQSQVGEGVCPIEGACVRFQSGPLPCQQVQSGSVSVGLRDALQQSRQTFFEVIRHVIEL